MAVELFGFSVGRSRNKKSEEEKKEALPSFAKPVGEDGATVIDSTTPVGGYFGSYVDFDNEVKTESEFINRYREMAIHPEVESAVEDICNESVVYDDTKQSIQLDLENVELSDAIKEKIYGEFEYIYGLLDFPTRGYEIFRRWYIDGRLYYHMVVDTKSPKKGIQDLRYVDPTKIKKVIEIEKDKEVNRNDQGIMANVVKKKEEYYMYRENPNTSEAIKIAPEAVCFVTSGLYDASNRKIISYLHKAIKPLNQLRMIEDAAVIYRISRAPERRVFYIDVGSLPKTKAEQYVKGIMNKYRNKLVYDASTGAIRDDKRHMSMLEDYWLPRREGGKGTEITTLDGGQNLGEMEDVEYFQKKLYQSLSIPRTRLESGDDFNIGRASEITRDEVKFMKYIDRLRRKFNEMFIEFLKTQCILKGVLTEDDWSKISQHLKFDYCRDNHFSDLKEYEILGERMNVLREVGQYIGKYFSVEWVRKNILSQNEDEIKDMDKQISQEREMGIITDDNNGGY